MVPRYGTSGIPGNALYPREALRGLNSGWFHANGHGGGGGTVSYRPHAVRAYGVNYVVAKGAVAVCVSGEVRVL